MKLNLIYDLQLSVLTHLRDGKYIFSTDSNVDVASFIIRGLIARHPDWHIYLVLPLPEQFADDRDIQDQFHGELPWDNITFLNVRHFGNPFMERLSFSPADLAESLVYNGDPIIDVVYTNDPCKVLAYKSFFHYRQMEKSEGGHVDVATMPVITRVHWVTGRADRKVPEALDFFIRQFEGVLASDWATFNSWFAVSLFLENAQEFFHANAIERVRVKCEGLETVDVEKMDRYHNETLGTQNRARYLEPELPIILWAHRLSYYTGWDQTFDTLSRLWLGGFRSFRVVATDPGNKVQQVDLAARFPFIIPLDKQHWTIADYVQLCWDADLVIGNHQHPSIWGGLAITEPMAARTAPLLPKRHSYPEMFYDDPHVFYQSDDALAFQTKAILTTPLLRQQLGILARQFCTERLSMIRFIDRIAAKIEYVCNH